MDGSSSLFQHVALTWRICMTFDYSTVEGGKEEMFIKRPWLLPHSSLSLYAYELGY